MKEFIFCTGLHNYNKLKEVFDKSLKECLRTEVKTKDRKVLRNSTKLNSKDNTLNSIRDKTYNRE